MAWTFLQPRIQYTMRQCNTSAKHYQGDLKSLFDPKCKLKQSVYLRYLILKGLHSWHKSPHQSFFLAALPRSPRLLTGQEMLLHIGKVHHLQRPNISAVYLQQPIHPVNKKKRSKKKQGKMNKHTLPPAFL